MSEAGSPDEIKPERKIPCGCIVLIVFVGIPFGFILLALLMIVGRDSAAKGRVRDQIAALKSAGKPVDDATLQTFYEENTSDENVDRWLELIALINNRSFYVDGKDLGPWSADFQGIPSEGEWPKETESREFRAKNSRTIDELKFLAMQRKRVRFPIKFQSFNTQILSIESGRSLQRLLSFETKIAIRDRDSQKTREGLSALLGLSIVVQGSPGIVSDLVAIAINGIATGELQSAMENDVLSENDLKQLLSEIQARRSLDREWKQAIASERATGLTIFTDPKMGKAIGVTAVPALSSDALSYLQAMAEFEEISTEDLNLFLAETEVASVKLEEKFRSIIRLDNILTAQVFPAMRQFAFAVVGQEMRLRIAELAIGIRLYKIKHGSFPPDLSALADIGIDPSKLVPIGSKPFGYRVENARAILWGSLLRHGMETPDQPPDLPSDKNNAVGENHNEWKWELP